MNRFTSIGCSIAGLFLGAWLFLGGAAPLRAQEPAAAPVDFDKDVRPLFAARCANCHGAEKQEGGLRLHSRQAALAGGDRGAAIVPGKSGESLLYKLVAGLDPDTVMPSEGERLSESQIRTLRDWIDQGADWPQEEDARAAAKTHWSFLPPVRPELPAVVHAAWVRNPIDAFVLARLEAESLAPAPEADRITLIRRLSLDLTGLPPSPAEVDAFVGDPAPDAYEQLVERLLASGHFGERWARHWLDVARYADTNGYEKDRERSIWPYRDWVIRAFNRDMPFDQFAIQQLAGDMLPGAGVDERVATGFHRNTMINEEGGIDVEEFRFLATIDRVKTTSAAFLGLTLGCTQCHSHKTDPFSQREYYELFAFLNNADEPEIEVPVPDVATKRAEILAQIDDRERALEKEYPVAPDGAGLDAALARWEAEVLPKCRHWVELKPHAMRSRNGATLGVQADYSVLVGGDVPNRDVYELELLAAAPRIAALRLEVLPDPSLPKGGPGRAPLFSVGDFLLTEFTVAAAPADVAGAAPQPVAIGAATHDFASEGRSAAMAIDGIGDTGWAVGGGQGKPHAAVFELREPLALAQGAKLSLTLFQNYIHQQTIGRFRISVTGDQGPVQASGLPADVERMVLVPAAQRTPEQQARLKGYFLSVAPALAEQHKQIAALRESLPAHPTTMAFVERMHDPRVTRIRRRGEFLSPTDPVEPATPGALHPFPADWPKNRLSFARWLLSEQNPLAARVTVNRAWSILFGRGIVASVDDFGVLGERPSHPELLDWLAVEFMDQNWSYKQLLRMIVASAAYRQSSHVRPEGLARDPGNLLLSRAPRLRLEGETLRDAALTAAGLLNVRVGGPSVYPPQPAGVSELAYGSPKWPVSEGADRYRRGLYTFMKRTAPYASFITFDGPTSETACMRRIRSNTPLQSLTLLNDPVFVEAAQGLARRVLREAPADDRQRLTLAFRLCVARPPVEAEMQRVLDFLAAQRQRFEANPANATEVALRDGETPDAAWNLPELAAWTATSRALLNLDEAITRE